MVISQEPETRDPDPENLAIKKLNQETQQRVCGITMTRPQWPSLIRKDP